MINKGTVFPFSPFILCGWIGGAILALLYFASLVNVLRLLYLCTTIEPGILLKLRSKVINYERLYKVVYETGNIQDTPQAYFSMKKFKICPVDNVGVADVNLVEVLSYCETCKIMRPPRSYHCGECGYCIEVHDHHCPWMGTCIGKRNIKYFVCFLGYTSMHALVTCIINSVFFGVKTYGNVSRLFDHDEDGKEQVPKAERVLHVFNVGYTLYAFLVFLFLLFFALSMHDKTMLNITTNE